VERDCAALGKCLGGAGNALLDETFLQVARTETVSRPIDVI
jgi:hypothetical protein